MANDESLFPHREPKRFYDFGMPDSTEWLVDEIIAHQWNGPEVVFQVKWNLGDTTWEPLEECEKLGALARYLEVIGVDEWRNLPKVAERDHSKATVKDTPVTSNPTTRTEEVVDNTTTPPQHIETHRGRVDDTTPPHRGTTVTRSGRAVRKPRRADE